MDADEREMDFTKSSMDMVSLNNLVVSLRGVMKRARLHVINKVNRQSKQLKTLKATQQRVVLNQRKAEKLVQEIGIIKELNIDQTIKYALGNTDSFDQVAKGGDLELKAMTRLATHSIIHEKVCKWRKEHEDWKALAAFLMSKNTGRRFKKRKMESIQDPTTQEQGLKTNSIELGHEQLADAPSDGQKKTKQRDGPSAIELGKQAVLEASKKRVDNLLAVRLARKTGSLAGNHSHKEDALESVAGVEKDIHEPKDEEESNGSSSDESVPNDEVVHTTKADGSGHSSSDDTEVEGMHVTKDDLVAESSSSDDFVPKSEGMDKANAEESESKSSDDSVREVEKGADTTKDEEEAGESSSDDSEEASPPIDAADEDEDNSDEESAHLASSSDNNTNSDSGEDLSEDESPAVTTPKKLGNVSQSITTAEERTKELKLEKDSQRHSPKVKVPDTQSKTNTEMEIRALNLSNISTDPTEIPVSQHAEQQVAFLFKGREEKEKVKRKKDNFFTSMGGSSDEDEDDLRTTKDEAFMDAGVAVDEDEEYPSFTRQKIESTFVGALSTHQRRPTRGHFGHRGGHFEKRTSGFSSHHDDRFSHRGRGRGLWRGDNRFERSSSIKSRGSPFGGTGTGRGTTGSTQQQKGAPQQQSFQDRAAKPLHPSWEASRKRKEQQNQIHTFQGKKIKFDD